MPQSLLPLKLPREGEECQSALTQRRTLWGSGALERGHGTPLERLAQLSDALSGVDALDQSELSIVEATEPVAGQAATRGARMTERVGVSAG